MLPYVADQPIGHFTHTYDAVGNRVVSVDPQGVTTKLLYNTLNQLTTIDPVGTGGPFNSNSCTFDAEQRLATIATVGATPTNTQFEYDHLGRCTAIHDLTVQPPPTRRFVWDDDQICAELDDTGSPVKYFFPQGMQIVSGPDAGLYYYTRDHLGSIREVVDGTGTIRAQYLYDPFGKAELIGPGTNIIEPDFGFAGMFRLPLSAGSGINLAKHRAYDPALGRWIARDPLDHAELVQGTNLYTYVGNNPVNLIDPSGMKCDLQLAAVELALYNSFVDCVGKKSPKCVSSLIVLFVALGALSQCTAGLPDVPFGPETGCAAGGDEAFLT